MKYAGKTFLINKNEHHRTLNYIHKIKYAVSLCRCYKILFNSKSTVLHHYYVKYILKAILQILEKEKKN